MTDDEILRKIQALFDNTFVDRVVVTRELTAENIDEWDSIRHVQILLQLEMLLGIRFKTDQIWRLKNVGDLVDVIRVLRAGQN